MATADEVVVEFEARVGKYEADLRRAQNTFERTTKSQEARMAAFERRISAGAGRVGATLAGIATVATAREFLRLVDSSKQIEAQLRLATRETGNFAQAQEDVRRIAMASRSGLEETAQLYATFQRNSRELGISQEEAARATETITKAFQVSGATAAEAAGGLRQFLQGIQSGTLRGEELNSVLENAPRLARALADGLNVTIGQLREMGQAGELTGREVINALQGASAQIDAEFRELPITFDQAMQQVENAATITFGAFDRGGAFSEMLANFITDGTQGFADLEQAAMETGIDIRSTFEGLADVFDPMLAAAQSIFGQIGSEAQSLADRIRPLLGEIDAISGWLSKQGLGGALLTGNSASDWWNNRPTSGTSLLGTFNRGQAAAEARRRNEIAAQSAADVFRGYDAMGNRISSGAPASRGGGGGGSGAARKAASAARKAESDRLRQIREDAANQRELASIDDDILAARAALATASEDILRFELQQIDSEKAQRLAQYQTEVRLGTLTQKEYEERAKLVDTLTDLQKQQVRGEAAQREADRLRDREREALRQRVDGLALEADALQARADIADTLEERRQLERQALAIQHEIERAMLDQAIAAGKIADAAEARRLLAERQGAEGRGVELDNMGALGRYARSMSDPAQDVEEAVARKLESVNQGISDALTDALGTDDQFVKDLFSIFLDQVIFRPLAEALDQAGGGDLLGGLFSSVTGAIFGGGRAIGGNVRAGVPYMVGETGREMFVPQQNGVIVPNHRLKAQGGTTVISSPKFDLRGAVVTAELYQDMERISRANAAQAAGKAYQQSMKDAPGAVQSAQRYGRR